MKQLASQKLYHRANAAIPGGVNSPVRSFQAVGSEPIFFQNGSGAYLTDVDNNRFIDYVCSWGPLILGHCHPQVTQAVQQALANGMSFGAPCELEVQLAELIKQHIGSIDLVRMVNSGTEATMTAIRLARGVTGRAKIVKFAGCYHGHNDSLLVKAGSGVLTLGQPSSPGITANNAADTLIANYNDLSHVNSIFEQYGKDIAAIIVEPIAGNMGCIPPRNGFLQGLREICDQYATILIFDEVMTGFRVALGGAQAYYQVTPDLTTLGKIIGGGMPVGALGGRKDIMEHLAPLGPVYQAGTLAGNPIAMAAGIATLAEISKTGFYENLNQRCAQLIEGLQQTAHAAKIPLLIQHAGSMFSMFFTNLEKITDYRQVKQVNTEGYVQLFHQLLTQQIYIAPSPYECLFMSSVHGKYEVTQTINAMETIFSKHFKEFI